MLTSKGAAKRAHAHAASMPPTLKHLRLERTSSGPPIATPDGPVTVADDIGITADIRASRVDRASAQATATAASIGRPGAEESPGQREGQDFRSARQFLFQSRHVAGRYLVSGDSWCQELSAAFRQPRPRTAPRTACVSSRAAAWFVRRGERVAHRVRVIAGVRDRRCGVRTRRYRGAGR